MNLSQQFSCLRLMLDDVCCLSVPNICLVVELLTPQGQNHVTVATDSSKCSVEIRHHSLDDAIYENVNQSERTICLVLVMGKILSIVF